ncbi:MAG: YafY family transcriptional regulator [Ignavibacteriae bacterium]|nr:YafY family transcriptional regulator [Ignavibacteriota bacterium]
MNRLDRLTSILIQLQSKRIVKAKEIAERFNISLRTVYRDIRSLESSGVPIGSEAGVGYYLISGYSLPPVMFTDEEANALLLGGKLIEKMSDQSISKEFNSALSKIRSVLNSSSKDNLELLESAIKVFNTPNNNQNSYIVKIQKSITLQKKISIEYFSPYSEENTQRSVNPIGLFFYSNAWHLIAFCNLRKDYRDFKVDRIKKITMSEKSFLIKNHSTLDDYIKMIKNKFELVLVKVKFKNKVAKLIGEQKHYYGFVEEVKNETETEMVFMVSFLDLMSRWLISFGEDVKVVSPKKLETNIKNLIKELNNHYK